MSIVKNVMKVLLPILFDVELVTFMPYVKGLKRLPFDRQYAVLSYVDGPKFEPECNYIGGEKYVLVPNKDIFEPLITVLSEKFKYLNVTVSNSDNDVFVVNFYSVAPDKRKNDYIAPAIRVENSYNGKKKARFTVSIYHIDKNGRESFLSTKSKVEYVFKHHSDEGAVDMTEMSSKVDEMLKEFNSIEEQIEILKKHEVKEITKTLEEIVPDAKLYPKKAIPLAVELVGYETEVFNTTPNLWIIYMALANAVKQDSFETKLKEYQKDEADSLAWVNVVNYANGQLKTKKKK